MILYIQYAYYGEISYSLNSELFGTHFTLTYSFGDGATLVHIHNLVIGTSLNMSRVP